MDRSNPTDDKESCIQQTKRCAGFKEFYFRTDWSEFM